MSNFFFAKSRRHPDHRMTSHLTTVQELELQNSDKADLAFNGLTCLPIKIVWLLLHVTWNIPQFLDQKLVLRNHVTAENFPLPLICYSGLEARGYLYARRSISKRKSQNYGYSNTRHVHTAHHDIIHISIFSSSLLLNHLSSSAARRSTLVLWKHIYILRIALHFARAEVVRTLRIHHVFWKPVIIRILADQFNHGNQRTKLSIKGRHLLHS